MELYLVLDISSKLEGEDLLFDKVKPPKIRSNIPPISPIPSIKIELLSKVFKPRAARRRIPSSTIMCPVAARVPAFGPDSRVFIVIKASKGPGSKAPERAIVNPKLN